MLAGMIAGMERAGGDVLENLNHPDSCETDASPKAVPKVVPQTRKRPIRTYGKRTAQSWKTEALPLPLKKRRTEDTTPADVSPPQLPELPKSEPAERGSILSYFKPVPSSSSLPLAPPSDAAAAQQQLTPPPSSTPSFKARKRRRPTTQPDVADGGGAAADYVRHGAPSDNVREDRSVHNCPLDEGEDAAPRRRAELEHREEVLQEMAFNTLDRTVSSGGVPANEAPGGKKKKKPMRRCSTKDMVQTTLSLSTNPGPGYTICNECGMLYNPLNEKDRQDHKKQHAAHVRRRNRGKRMQDKRLD